MTMLVHAVELTNKIAMESALVLASLLSGPRRISRKFFLRYVPGSAVRRSILSIVRDIALPRVKRGWNEMHVGNVVELIRRDWVVVRVISFLYPLFPVS